MAFLPNTNITQVLGQPINTGIGNAGANGTIRVVIASDQPAIAVTGGGGGGSGTQYAEGTVVATPTGTVAMGWGSIDTKAHALRVDASNNLFTVVGNFPSNQLVSGTVASGAADANNPVKIGGVFNTTQPTVSNGQRVDVQSTARGAVIVATGADAFVVSGTVAVTQSTSPWAVSGAAASGTTKAGSPVQSGAVFNTTQPTVINGQVVENQATARGGLIVATGVDGFSVAITGSLPTGANVIGHVIVDSGSTTAVTGTIAVTQSTSPWVVSLTSTTVTGTVAVTQSTSPWVTQDNADVVAGTTSAPSKILIVGGKTIDGTPQYQPILQGPGGRSVIVEGNASGVAIPVTISGGGGSSIGAITYALPSVSAYLTTPINFSASGDNTVIASVVSQTVRVFRMFLVAGGACNLTFKDSTPTSYTGPIPMAKYGSIAFQLEGDPHFVTGSGKAFVINIDAAVQISGKIEYIQA